MNLWLEAGGILAASAIGIALAQWLGHRSNPWRIGSFLLGFAAIILFGGSAFWPSLNITWFVPHFVRHGVLALAVPVLLWMPAAQLPRRRTRFCVRMFCILCVASFVLAPVFLPLTIHAKLAGLKTRMDHGVCLQQTDFTCGPAAATTALRQLGLPADEGTIAIWSHTSPLGTTTGDMAGALHAHYAEIRVRFLQPKTVEELAGHFPFLAVMKYDSFTDHSVAVLGLDDRHIIIGDPLNGLVEMPREEFEQNWRHYGFAIEKFPPVPH